MALRFLRLLRKYFCLGKLPRLNSVFGISLGLDRSDDSSVEEMELQEHGQQKTKKVVAVPPVTTSQPVGMGPHRGGKKLEGQEQRRRAYAFKQETWRSEETNLTYLKNSVESCSETSSPPTRCYVLENRQSSQESYNYEGSASEILIVAPVVLKRRATLASMNFDRKEF